jgi:hypothetical protein
VHVTASPEAGLAAASSRRAWRLAVGTRVLRVVTGALVAVGVAAGVGGVALDVNAATQAKAWVSVPVYVRLHQLDKLQILRATGPGTQTLVPFRLQHGLYQPGLTLYVAGIPQDTWINVGMNRPFTLRAWGSTITEQLLSRGADLITGLCLMWGALVVRRLVLSIGRGQPFQRGNPARVTQVAGLIVAATVAAGVFPYLAAHRVLGRLGLSGPASPLYAHLAIAGAPLLVALFLLVLAQAFRRGAELAQDTEGLV